MNSYERSILQVTCYGHFLSHFNMLVFPAVLLPLSHHLQLSLVDTLALSFWMYLLFGVTALPWGMLADKLSPRSLLMLFYAGAGSCGLLAAFSLNSAVMLSVALTGVGLFSGIYHPVGLGWIAREIQNTSIGMGYNGMFGNFGLATAPLLAGLVNLFFGISAVFIMLGIFNLAGIIFLLRTNNSSAVNSPSKKMEAGNSSMIAFCILLVAMMLGGIVYRGTSVSLPAYFELNNSSLFETVSGFFGGKGDQNVLATMITSAIYFLGMAGQYCGGRVGEKYDLRLAYLGFHIITVPAAIVMAMTTDQLLIVFAMIHSFFLLGMQPIENTLVSRLAPPGLMSSAYGLKFILTFGVGALSVKIVEKVQSGYSFSAVYLVLAAVSALLVGCILLLITRTRSLQATS